MAGTGPVTEHSPSEFFFRADPAPEWRALYLVFKKFLLCRSRQVVSLGSFLEEEDREEKEKKNPMPFESEDGDQP